MMTILGWILKIILGRIFCRRSFNMKDSGIDSAMDSNSDVMMMDSGMDSEEDSEEDAGVDSEGDPSVKHSDEVSQVNSGVDLMKS